MSRRVRRILVLAPFPPRRDGTHGGSRTVAELVTRLAARHSVALACLRSADEPPAGPEVYESCELVREIRRPGCGRLARLPRLVRGMPMWVSARTVPAFAACVRGLARSWRPEIVQAEYHAMGQYFDALDGGDALRVLTEHEPGASAAREAAARSPVAARLVVRADVRAWERYERAVLGAVDAVVVYTERDRAALAPLAGATPVVRIPLGAHLPQQPLDPVGSEPALLFVGNYQHPPNLDAARRLLDAIFPAVRARRPDARLYLVGDGAPAELLARTDAGVITTGRVPSIAPFLDKAAVVVAPLRLGGGMRVKVLDALAAGKAVVASPLAVEGLDAVGGEHLLVAETDAALAADTLRLLDDPTLRRSLAERARAWAVASLGWARCVEGYETLYDSFDEAEHPPLAGASPCPS